MKWKWIDPWAVPIGFLFLVVCLPAGIGCFIVFDWFRWQMGEETINRYHAGVVVLLFCVYRFVVWGGICKRRDADPSR